MEEEVRRLTDCPECAKIHAEVLKTLQREEESVKTQRLAEALAYLLETRRCTTPTDKTLRIEAVKEAEAKVRKIREEIEMIDGWFYGRKNKTVPWPADSVKHQWGTYGQPLCDCCKKYSLDYSTISADLHYVLHEESSEKECFNGISKQEGA